MKRNIIFKQVITTVLALALVCGFLVWSEGRHTAAYCSYSVVALGDSILGEYREADSITEQLAGALGVPVYNGALGGTSMARRDQSRSLGENEDGFSMVSLSKAIAARDFGVQQTIHLKDGGTDYFDETIDEMGKIDYRDTKLILIEHCVNDYQSAVPITNEADPWDEYTYTGALRSSIRTLQDTYPNLRIVLVTPTYTWYPDVALTCEEYDLGGGVLEDYVNAQIAVAQEMDVEIIDLYHDFYPHETWEDWQIYSRDGLHPNAEGRQRIAQALIDYFVEHP